MKTFKTFFMASLLAVNGLCAQTTPVPLVNFDFNSGSGFPYAANATESGISCSLTSNTTFTLVPGLNTSGSAFYTNTQGTGLVVPDYAGDEAGAKYFLFRFGGSNLYSYESYKLYFQTNRNATGASTMAVQYSTDGTNFTHFNYYDIPAYSNPYNLDMTSISALNGASDFYIKIKIYAGSSGGVCRFDNFQAQGLPVSAGGSNQSGWQVSTNNISTMKNVGIGTNSPAFPLDVAGAARISGDLTVDGNLNTSRLVFGGSGSTVTFSSAVTPNNARIIGIFDATLGPVFHPTTCMAPFKTGDFQVNHRTTITYAPAKNMLDFTNDGLNGFIDYGFDININPMIEEGAPTPPTPRPALKLNSICWGDVEIAKGGGFANLCPYVEVGTLTRNSLVTMNIKSTSGQAVAIQVADATNKINFKVKPNGYVYAREINVMPANITFPDYVFAKGYKLLPLTELESYVNTNKHLPNIPSAAEVESNGINLAELQIKQMEKIEELYLYIIELKKENEALKQRMDALNK